MLLKHASRTLFVGTAEADGPVLEAAGAAGTVIRAVDGDGHVGNAFRT